MKKFAQTPERFKRGPKYESFNAEAHRSEKPTATVAQSPALLTKARAQQNPHPAEPSTAAREAEVLAKVKPFKAQPVNEHVMNSAGDYGLPVVKPKTTTVIKPFAASEKYQNPYETRRQVREAAIKAERDAHPAFQATGLPMEDKSTLPAAATKASTKPAPFKFRSESIRVKQKEKFDRQTRQDAKARAAAHNFKAQPVNENMMNSAGDYGIPVVKPKALTVINAFPLKSVQRASDRATYETRKKTQQTLEAKQATVANAIAKKAAAKELESFRSAKVHKARPMPQYTVMKVKPSQKITTIPSSPLVLKRGPTGIRA